MGCNCNKKIIKPLAPVPTPPQPPQPQMQQPQQIYKPPPPVRSA